ncbi:MAG: hypothetical protein AOA65_1548 [Candidatus Bathyarchaeota archaeon BA1]|nr:MAG: hypothetical protein AOA65_1548 [Candidatus Bathyarchaeota archaeon BA1]
MIEFQRVIQLGKLNLEAFVPTKVVTAKKYVYKLNVAYEGEVVFTGYKSKRRKPDMMTVPEVYFALWYSYELPLRTAIRFCSLLLPKYIEYDKLTRQCIGLMKAELAKSFRRKYTSTNVNFSNSSPDLLDMILVCLRG